VSFYDILFSMIDWYSGLVGYDGSALRLNKVLELTPDGDIKWSSERKLKAVGSYDSSVYLGRSVPSNDMLSATSKYDLECMPVCLYLSGNPSKFLQGHNVFGPSVSALGPVIQATVRGLPGELRPADSDSPLLPAVSRTRVDITTSVDLGNHRLVHEWLHTAATNTRSRHGRAEIDDRHGRNLVSGDTVYWGKHSRRWTMKAYCKACELRQHGPGDLVFRSALEDYCQGQLRLELTLRSLELKPRGTLDESIIWEFMDKIEVGVMKANENVSHPDLPEIVQFTLSRWIAGEDLRHSLPIRKFQRHRRAILDKLGLDISLSYEKKTAERQVFDLDYLKAHEIKIVPDLFQGKLFKPERSPVFSAH
jgi:hypothetical protein